MKEHERDILDAATLREEISSRRLAIGLPLTVVSEAGSTNDLAIEAAREGAPHGALFVADQQTRGRGRLGRIWQSPAGMNLYWSVVLRLDVPLEQLARLTLVVGIAVADAAAMFVPSNDVQIRWPNDVLVRGRKVAGILVESASTGTSIDYVVAGIGINVLQETFEPEIASIATSVAVHAPHPPHRREMLCAALEQLAKRLGQFERLGLQGMFDDLCARDATLGRTVKCAIGEGLADGIETDGRLRVKLGDGRLVSIQSGELEIVG